jgi:predicted permease
VITDGEKRPLLPTVGLILRHILLHPLIVASYCGALVAALHIQPPIAIDSMLQFLQSAAAPVALFALGVTVALRPFKRVPWEVPGMILVKLAIHPLVAFGLLVLLGPFPEGWAATALLLASLPPALNVFVIARQYDTWIEQASTAVLLGTFVSVVTLTSAMWLIKTGAVAFP